MNPRGPASDANEASVPWFALTGSIGAIDPSTIPTTSLPRTRMLDVASGDVRVVVPGYPQRVWIDRGQDHVRAATPLPGALARE